MELATSPVNNSESKGYKQRHLTVSEVSSLWNQATGDTKGIEGVKQGNYVSHELWDGNGAHVKIELYPDLLNNRHKLVVQDFSASEGDDHYIDCLQLVAHALGSLRTGGMNISLEGLKDYSDGSVIIKDINAIMKEI